MNLSIYCRSELAALPDQIKRASVQRSEAEQKLLTSRDRISKATQLFETREGERFKLIEKNRVWLFACCCCSADASLVTRNDECKIKIAASLSRYLLAFLPKLAENLPERLHELLSTLDSLSKEVLCFNCKERLFPLKFEEKIYLFDDGGGNVCRKCQEMLTLQNSQLIVDLSSTAALRKWTSIYYAIKILAYNYPCFPC